jgi:hypothetical protein
MIEGEKNTLENIEKIIKASCIYEVNFEKLDKHIVKEKFF